MGKRSGRRGGHGKRIRAILAAATCAGGITLGALIVRGADFSLDADGQVPVDGGHGIWNAFEARWWNGANFVTWPNATTSNAYFGGPERGSALLDSSRLAGQLTFGNDYRLYRSRWGTASLSFSMVDTGPHRVESTVAYTGGGFAKLGSGMLIMHAGNGNLAGTIDINEGTLAYGNSADANFSSTTIFNIAAGATLDMGDWAGGFYSDTVGNLQGAGSIRLGTATGLATVTGGVLTAGISGGSVEFSGSISGGGRFTKEGTGTTVFSGTNIYTGGTVIAGGTLRLTTDTALPAQGTVNVGSSGRLLLDANASLGAVHNSGTIELGTNTLTVGSSNSDESSSGNFTGSGTIINTGDASSWISRTSGNTFTGKYRIDSGTLVFGADNGFGATPAAVVPDLVTLAGGVLAVRGSVTMHANRGITVVQDSGISGLNNVSADLRVNGTITGSHALTKTGPGKLTINSDNGSSFTGDWIVRDGILGTTNALAPRPFGTGGFHVVGSQIDILPASAAVAVTSELAPGPGKNFQFGPGVILNTFKGATNSSLTVNLGDAAAATSSLVRSTGGSMVINAQSGVAAFGAVGGEIVHVNGGVSLTNGIIPGLVVTDGAAHTAGDLVGYNGANMTVATYSSSDLATSLPADTVNQLTPGTLGSNAAAYALRVGDNATAVAIDTGGNQIDLGDGSNNPAQLILNQGSSIAGAGAVHFGTSEGLVYAQSQTGGATISTTLCGSAGIHKIGAGALNLTTGANYTGTTTISQGVLSLQGNNLLPAGTDLVLRNKGALALNGNSLTVASLNSSNVGASIDLGIDGSLTVGTGDMQFVGSVTNGAGATDSKIIKDGPGRLTIGFEYSANSQQSTQLFYNKLAVRNGGVVNVADVISLPIASTTPGVAVPDAIVLDGGTLRFSSRAGLFPAYFYVCDSTRLRGLTIGAGGGTIEVMDPKKTVYWRRGDSDQSPHVAQLISGPGTLYKTGPGALLLGVGNDNFTGKIVVTGGTLEFPSDIPVGAFFGNALGPAPATLVPDQLTLDGGTLRASGSGYGRVAPTRGVTIGPGGATLDLSGSLDFRNPFFGSGAISIVQGNSLGAGSTSLGYRDVRFLASSPQLSGTVNIFNGAVLVGADTALGTGDVNITPQFPVLLQGSSGVTLPNNITLNPGSLIDTRVDGGFAGDFVLSGNIAGANGFAKNRIGLSSGTLDGAGRLALSGNNTFHGDIFVQHGMLIAQSTTALGSADGVTVVSSGASLGVRNVGNYSNPETIYIAGIGYDVPSPRGVLQNLAGSNRLPGDVILTSFAGIGILSGNLQVGGVRGASQLQKTGPGTFTADYYRLSDLRVLQATVGVSAKPVSGSPSGTSMLFGLTLDPGTSFDISNNAVVVDYVFTSPLPAIRDWIIASYNNGAWNQPGITSSMADSSQFAIGYAEASDLSTVPPTFGTVDPTAVLFRHTRYGDADLNGVVNLADFNRLAMNFGAAGIFWSGGDFSYDLLVNLVDFNLLAGNFGLTASPDGPTPQDWATLASVVPEPALMGLFPVASIVLIRRQPRKVTTLPCENS